MSPSSRTSLAKRDAALRFELAVIHTMMLRPTMKKYTSRFPSARKKMKRTER